MDYVKKVLNVEGVIGQGAFGRVLLTSPIQNQTTRYALKCVHPILRPQRLASELRHLRDLGGKRNVVQLHTAHFHKGSLFIVMELIDHDRFVDIIAQLNHEEIVIYMKNLLIALEHVHAQNIIHRDIKPANFLFDRKNRKFLLVDFGLAQKIRTQQISSKPPITTNTTSPPKMNQMNFFIAESPNAPTKRPADAAYCSQMLKKLRVSTNGESREPVRLTVGAYESPVTNNDSSYRTRNNINDNHIFSTPKIPSRRRPVSARCDCRCKPKTCNICMSRPDSNASRSGTPGFKAPEVLLRHGNQTTAVDIWSAGVIFVCLLAGHSPFFRDTEDSVSLSEIITIFGSHRLIQAAKVLGIRLNVEPKREPVDLTNLCKSIRLNSKDKLQINIPDAAFDLLHQMLDPNPHTRITAKDALEHPWFALSPE